MRNLLRRMFAGDSVRRVVRTFVISSAFIFLPGALGWLNDLTAWAGSNGQHPFPDAHNLSYLLVSAVAGGLIAVGNALVIAVENVSGRGFLRNPVPSIEAPATPDRPPAT
jgi:hypothetical protein